MELDQIGEFLMMASYLLSLKARMLLPGKPETTEDEESRSPRRTGQPAHRLQNAIKRRRNGWHYD
jgi:chromatin segregation and condensation protein Rec8/ScpA/Scc1 (kleisin family)